MLLKVGEVEVGYIIVKRIYHNSSQQKINILNEAIGSSITYQGAVSIAEHLLELKSQRS